MVQQTQGIQGARRVIPVKPDGTVIDQSAGDPINKAVTANLSDTVDLTNGLTRAVWVGTAGNLVVDWSDGTTSTLNSVQAGVVHPLRVKRIRLTGTTAANVQALY